MTAALRVLVSGASGFIGSQLTARLRADGHEVHRLVRRTPSASDEHYWDPAEGTLDVALIDSVDAVINLSGAGLEHLPWTRAYRQQIVDSRLSTTSTIAAAIGRSSSPPSTLLNASAVGFYGDRPREDLTEDSARGDGFLADVCAAWEAAAHQASSASRVVSFRTGVVVGRGGAFSMLEPLTRFGLGANLGSGQQRWPWIGLADEVGAIRHLLTSTLSGPVTLVGPTPATADAVTRRLALAMGRPRVWGIPRFAIEAGLRTPGRELLLADQRVIPSRLLDDGYVFENPTVEDAIRATWNARA
jgi:uncharacterized protein